MKHLRKKKKIKALLLAAGYGSRLRPLTLSIPKCLVPIHGIPILEIWLQKLESIGCSQVIINTHYKSDQVLDYIKSRRTSEMEIVMKHEINLLGTAGTLMRFSKDLSDSDILLIHADNLMEESLGKLMDKFYQQRNSSLMTMLTFDTSQPRQCGIVEIDNNEYVSGFYEKMDDPPSSIANAAVFVFDQRLLGFVQDQKNSFFDFSKEVIPCLLGKIKTYHTSLKFIDIGTPQAYNYANSLESISKFLT